ncbi:hypothetical protein BGZ65_002985 [Modicella reniformis]|uniref:F-box domain-containing protein n=1 Tax=Modicella reniformis TaxID=1440133 RepID=A0A9P6IL46_9FUNG|nr:hypothetical protein BGZ65_002985 [Modicella reniformis]
MTAPQKVSPLEIPEVLEVIFAHLNLYSIRVHASLVCRLWYKVAAPIFRSRPLVWYRVPKDAKSQSALHKRLQETKALIIKKPNYFGSYILVPLICDISPSWVELIKQLTTLSDARQLQQITELTILQRLESEILLFSILTILGPQLTQLRLENMNVVVVYATTLPNSFRDSAYPSIEDSFNR